MENYTEKAYKAFEMFARQWAIVTAGTMERHNGCTVGWGSVGTIWRRPTVTVYVHPARYTSEFLQKSEYFTVSFFPEEYRRAVAYMGSHSGRDGDKARAAGLTPVAMGHGVTYEEAELTFLCRKLCQHPFDPAALSPDIQQYYAAQPDTFPDFQGGWQPHLVFVGEIMDCKD